MAIPARLNDSVVRAGCNISPSQSSAQLTKSAMSDPKKYKILIVDDDKFLLDMYAVKFKNSGFEVDLAQGALEGIEKLKNSDNKPDGILLDMVMPGMDGMDFLNAVKKDKLAEQASIIVLTNQEQSGETDKTKGFRISGYIIKAATVPSGVVEDVRKILEKK